jgi:PAS domain S-box-containing protein
MDEVPKPEGAAPARWGESAFRRLLQNLPGGAYTCDPHGLITGFNRRAAEVWGREPKLNDPSDRYCGSVRLFTPDGTPVRHDDCWMARALREQRDYCGREIVVQRPDGSRVTVLAHATVLRDDQGQVVGAVNVLLDISDRKQAEQNDAMLRALIASSEDAIIATTAEGVVTMWNPAAERLFGYRSMQMLDQPVGRLLPAGREGEDERIMAKLLAGEHVEHFETTRLTSDGHVVEVSLTMSLIRDRGDRPIGMSQIARDISVRRQAERSASARLERLVAQRTAEAEHTAWQLRVLAGELTLAEQRERLRIARVLHDELGQSLALAKMKLSAASLALVDGRTRAVLEEAEQAIAKAIGDTRSLMHDMSPPMLHDLGLPEALAGLAGRMQREHGLNIAVQSRLHSRSQSLREDLRTLLYQAARELLINAVKHGGATQATVALAEFGGQLQMSVQDNGCGYAADPADLRPNAQRGLGLFSLRERLLLIGGRLEICGCAGGGTLVRLTVPAADEPAASGEAAACRIGQTAAVPHSRNGRIRVMLADDHRILREGLAGVLLEHQDLELVGAAEDGMAALELAARLHPDVAVIDVSMPRLNGVEVTRRLKRAYPQIAVVGLSMHTEADMAERMRRAGAVAYLTKDGPIELLLNTIRSTAHSGR